MPPPFWELEQAISFSAGFLFDKISKTKGLGGGQLSEGAPCAYG